MTPLGDFIGSVPKDVVGNLEWRIKMRTMAAADRHVQDCLRQAAFDDVLFFFNAFLWVIEPRAQAAILPFVTWPHQDPVLLEMDRAIDDALSTKKPLALTLVKSRAQGGTFGYLGVFIRRALRDTMFLVGLVTRNEKTVDSMTDQNAILWKVAWLLDQLPYWLMPSGYLRSLSDHTILLPDTGSLFTGFAATGDLARGGRQTVFALDEFGSDEFIQAGKDYRVMSSVASVSNCTFLVSTFGGETGVFYEAATDAENTRLLKLDWKDNPTQTKNAYVMRMGRLWAMNPADQMAVTEYSKTYAAELKKLERRGHVMEGKFRSPWYDAHCLLPGATPRFVARELDMNPRGAVGKVFDLEVLDRMKEKHCRRPDWQGKPIFDAETLELKGLVQQENGPLKLWFEPGLDNAPPPGRYAVGCDISAGGTSENASNSVASGVNLHSGHQVMEYAERGIQPTKFARISVGLAKWLNKAYLGWETTGPTGSTFGKEVLEILYYPNIYYREAEEIGSRVKTRKAGWANYNGDDKAELFENLCIAMESGEFIPHSDDLIRECAEYEWVGGKIVHRPSKLEGMDEKAHGDRCVGAGIANLLCRDRLQSGLDKDREARQDAPVGSIAWFEEQDRARKRQREANDAVDFGVSAMGGQRNQLLGSAISRLGGW